MESFIYPAQGITVASIVLQYSLYLGYEGVGYHKANSYANKTRADGKISRQFIGLFGSIIRDDFNPASDIDIIVNFSRPIGIEFIDLADYIENKLRKSIDLVSGKG